MDIEATHLHKAYPRKVAVQDISFSVAQGEVFGFLGPNGAGKTTTIKMLLGLISPTRGTPKLLGQTPDSLEVKRQVGFLPELFRFHDWLSGKDLLRWHGRLCGMTEQELDRRIPEVLDQVGLSQHGDRKVKGYSKGMQQRVGLAQAILHKPRIVFLDEPTSALDPLGRRQVRNIIHHLQEQGTTVFLNSHLLSEVELTCDRVCIVQNGQVLRTGSLQELLKGTLEVEILSEKMTEDLKAELQSFAEVLDFTWNTAHLRVSDEKDIARIAEVLFKHRCPIYGLTPQKRTLEDLYVSLMEAR
ncbi:ABC transporter ATP-binding protein [Deinococcus cellulosilyticus]|uniref:ABC transporter ATP-binding protein n=1 Tax=Deinococcus cellulosilyticus (strain DSM 18568 / NBRC 106333 / KACC 11606 / 5516J-15) TaxID=1223518 RepID=A0A511N9J6_DEIC1|nr:ABC transporter ATP-binding protein [Deinococcus cellulosilyticus]GEM49504.1 ABC transporter ATP-binding protein [Deinococcus cellulosilyticus NBRC 106333 = KACC 11606]